MSSGPSLRLDSQPFATTHGLEGELYRLAAGAVEISILTSGRTIQSLRVPDRAGETANVVLGFPELDGYLTAGGAYFGPIVGVTRTGSRAASSSSTDALPAVA